MTIEERIPEMNQKELENLQLNAERLVKGGSPKQQADAARLLPIIAAAMETRRTERVVELAEKKVARQRDLAEGRAKKAARKKAAEAEAEAR